MTASTPGKLGCRCINATAELSSLTGRRRCSVLSTGKPGVRLTIGGSCVPYAYGSFKCRMHDLNLDPECLTENSDDVMPSYCNQPWCYVNSEACARESNERVFRSSYFDFNSGVDLFYSYSTCNSTADAWFDIEEEVIPRTTLNEVSIKANVPTYVLPMMFKRDSNGMALNATGSEYYDNRVLFEGVYPSYVEKLVEISNGDISKFTYTHRSRVSSDLHPSSSFTAAVQDLKDGLVDMSVGPFWITRERLNMTAFTVPIVVDRTYLVIPRPGSAETLNDQIGKVLAPFEDGLWLMLLGIIAITALLSVWFSDRTSMIKDTHGLRRSLQQNKHPLRRRKRAYLRLVIDSFLEKGIYFCSAGVEQERGASLPNKLLMFGFAFFILISVSAYVANLAAFLTRKSISGSVSTIEGAIANGWKICAHIATKTDLEKKWNYDEFVFSESGKEFHGIMDDYEAGKCVALAVGWEDTSMDRSFLKRICNQGLAYTDSVVIETPIAFPIRSQLAAGFSYWMMHAERESGMSLQTAKDDYVNNEMGGQSDGCELKLDSEFIESSDYDPITLKNMALPLILFLSCCVLAVICQLVHQYYEDQGIQRTLIDRTSRLNLVTDEPALHPVIGQVASRAKRLTVLGSAHSKKDDEPQCNDEDSALGEYKKDSFYDDGELGTCELK